METGSRSLVIIAANGGESGDRGPLGCINVMDLLPDSREQKEKMAGKMARTKSISQWGINVLNAV